MLNVTHVTKRYHKVVANDDINFALQDGQIGILLGPNGAGKSTIIKCIMGFLKYEGMIQMDGLANKSISAKRLMGYVPEIPSLYPNLTVDEHLEFIARAYKLTDYQAYKDELLQRFELDDKKKKFGDELSKGMQQKLSICCGLLPKPKLILFDEPMIGLDPHAIKELKKMFVELKEQGCSLLISTHMIDSIEELWDTTYIMKTGKIAAVVEKKDVKQLAALCKEKKFESGAYLLIGILISHYDSEDVFASEREALDYAFSVVNEDITEDEALKKIAKKILPTQHKEMKILFR